MLPLTARTALFTIRSTSQFQCLILRQQCSRQRLAPTAHCVRPLSQSTHFSYPRKDAQDKDSINTEATEYSKSGTDDEGARQEDAAFDPNVTDPQDQKDVAGKDGNGEDSGGSNPLEVSPANPEVSKPRGKSEGGAESSSASSDTNSDRKRSSGGGGPEKGGKVA